MRKLLVSGVVFFSLLTSVFSQSPSWVWGREIAASSADASSFHYHTTTPLGNSYVSGSYSDSLKMGLYTLINPDSGTYRGFVAKYNTNGNCVWAQSLGNRENFMGCIISDKDENIYLAGSFKNTLVIGSDTLVSAGDWDLVYCKLDSAGNILWARNTGGDTSEFVYGIGLDTLGNIYLTGTFRPHTAFGTFNLTSAGGTDIFIVKIDSAGIPVWAINSGGPLNQNLRYSRTDTYGNTYLTGQVVNPSVFGTYTLNPTFGGNDIYIVKFDPAGNCSWAEMLGGPGQDSPRSVGYDKYGNVYITGNYTDSVYCGSFALGSYGLADIYLAKYNSAGQELWINHIGGPAWDFPGDLVTDRIGNSYLVGYYRDWIKFSSELPPMDTALVFSDIFVCKYDSGGTFKWFKTAAGHGWEAPSTIGIDVGNNTYIIGIYDSTCIFDPVDSLTKLNGGNHFIAKIDNVVIIGMEDDLGSSSNELFSVFPNPSNGLFTIRPDKVFDGKLCITDISGRLVREITLLKNGSIEIDLSSEPAGMYFIRLIGDEFSGTRKIIKN